MTNGKQRNKQTAGVARLHVNANYSNLYYFQNHLYIRFMSFMDKKQNKKQSIQSGTTKTLKGNNVQ